MEFLKILVLLGTVGNVFGGGDSKCSVIKNDILVLMQAFESMIDGMLNIVNNTVTSSPYVGNSSIRDYFCFLNATSYIFALEISRMTGVNIDYILGIFTGTVNPPFLEPLDCIDIELMSYYLHTQNIETTLIPQLEALVQISPINENTPCSTVIQIETPYFKRDVHLATLVTNAAISRAAVFESINKTSLYADYMNSINICTSKTLTNMYAELLNMNTSIVGEYLANQSISVPPPLSCIQGLVNSIVDTVNSTFNTINNTVTNPNTSSNCEPFYSKFIEFERVWYKYFNELRDHAINQSIAYPELTPFFIATLICEIDVMIIFAANATSHLSNVDSDVIHNIIKGSTAPPFIAPLDCIRNELLFMSNQTSTLVNSIIPGLQNIYVNSSSDTSTCNKTYQALTPYVGRIVTLLNRKGLIITNATIDFKSISLDELFLETLASVLDCLPNLVGKYVSTALDGQSSTSVTAYVNGNRFTLPYPYTCVKIIINIINSIMNQALVNFVTDSATNVVVAPRVPVFRG